MKKNILLVTTVLVGICAAAGAPATAGGPQTIRHELGAGVSWFAEDFTEDQYVVNGEPLPSAVGTSQRDTAVVEGVYTFYLTPVREEPQIPIALRRFYAHPTTLSLSASLQPETEMTRQFQNPENNDYWTKTWRDERSRSLGLTAEYYLFGNTGLWLSIASAKDESQMEQVNSRDQQSSGDTEQIRRYYGLGLSQYVTDHARFNLRITALDTEYVGHERNWEADNPLLFTDYTRETETTGYRLTCSGEYIFRRRIGLHGFYQFQASDAQSSTWFSYYENFPGQTTTYEDEATRQTVGATLSLYIGKAATLRLGGSVAWHELEQVYETEQIIEYDWSELTAETTLHVYLTRHLGLCLSYALTFRHGDVLTWHPDSQGDPRTTSVTDTDIQTLDIGLRGRF
jgi:hypothetical protein